MQKAVGVRELGASASRILRRVREKREAVDVTYRGEVVARIVPVVSASESAKAASAVWSEIDQLAAEIGRHWHPKTKSAVATVREGRRG
jgi:antitoxin (DNA-binding transcriptional repressor) of toxin-antitoxin stability system